MKRHNDTKKHQSATSMFSIATFSHIWSRFNNSQVDQTGHRGVLYNVMKHHNDTALQEMTSVNVTMSLSTLLWIKNLIEQHKTVGQKGHHYSVS